MTSGSTGHRPVGSNLSERAMRGVADKSCSIGSMPSFIAIFSFCAVSTHAPIFAGLKAFRKAELKAVVVNAVSPVIQGRSKARLQFQRGFHDG